MPRHATPRPATPRHANTCTTPPRPSPPLPAPPQDLAEIFEGHRTALAGIDVLRKICNHPDLLERAKWEAAQVGYAHALLARCWHAAGALLGRAGERASGWVGGWVVAGWERKGQGWSCTALAPGAFWVPGL